MDYQYAKTLPNKEVEILMMAVNDMRKREEQAIANARAKLNG